MATILVIDDEASNRMLLATILQYGGHTVLEAADGVEGLRLTHEAHPDLIILDMYLPGMHGTEFMQRLRSQPEIAGSKVALYTATTMNVLIEGFMELAGIRHVIPKPAGPQEVLQAVDTALSESG